MKHWQILVLVTLALSSLHFFGSQTGAGSSDFQLWKAENGLHFTQQEESYREMIFLQNMQEIERHNANPKRSFTKGVNQFTHLSAGEFAEMFLSSIYYRENSPLVKKEIGPTTVEPLREIDWQALGKVSAVKDQGNCDAGYAFCSSSLIESFYLLENRNVTLSEQQIVDCSAEYTTFGCQSGSRNGTLTYIRDKGLSTAAEYPYKGVKNTCQKQTGAFKPVYTHVEFNGCAAIQNALYASPLTVAVDAKSWQTYKSGIYDQCTTEVNHDILLIGVTTGYWRLKNSWGIKWGEFGYIRLKSVNTCGICEKPAFGFKK